MISIFSLFLLFHLTWCSSNNTAPELEDPEILEEIHGNILCRSCGNEVASSSYLISKYTPYSLYSFQDSIFDKDEVLIQVLVNEFGLNFPVITTNTSNCSGIQEWEEGGSWFPGYRMKPCVCPDCGKYIGWVFEPLDSDFVETTSTFFGLILTSLIGESFVNSLTVIPGGFFY